MAVLELDVRLDGFPDPIGTLIGREDTSLAFSYAADFLRDPSAFPLSLSLPLRDDPYGDVDARPFFDNLLQERDGALRQILDRERLSRENVAGILLHLGKDCAGALSVLPKGSPAVKVPGDYETDYARIEPDKLDEIIRALHTRQRLPADVSDPSPLAGVQSKIAVTVLPDQRFAEAIPGSGAPTTHILKVPDAQHLQDPKLEAEALNLSRKLGFETADATVMNFDGIDALCVTRFDRALSAESKIIRLHQEDFAQALGLPATFKYERNGEPGRRFNVESIARILDMVDNPAGEKQTFIRATLFDMMIGNVDGHAKNFALLYQAEGGIRVTPRYDLIPTRIDPQLTDEFAYYIGEAKTLDEVTREDFGAFLSALGIQSRRAQDRIINSLAVPIADGLVAEFGRMERENMGRFADLIAHNIGILLPALGLPLPAGGNGRDAYIERGGGWLLGS